jgi:hypothetical protein
MLMAACSENPVQTGPSPLRDEAPIASRHQAGGTSAFRTAAQTPYSCPSDAPLLFRANSREDGDTVDLSWEATPNVTRYTFEVEHLEGTIWVPAGGGQVYPTAADAMVFATYRAMEYGRYRVRVRNSRSEGCNELPEARWSAWEEFSKRDASELTSPDPPPGAIPEPVEEDEDDCEYVYTHGGTRGYYYCDARVR